MRKIRNLTGMPVICSRQKVGRLVQAELSSDLKRLEGIWIDSGLMGTRYIPADQLSLIGAHAILSDTRGKRRRCNADALLRRAIACDGQRAGAIVGAEIDEMSFLVCALELTGGFWDDLVSGRTRVEHFRAQDDGDVVLLDSAQKDESEDEA